MDRSKAEKLMRLHEEGFMVLVDSIYVDGPVKSIYEKDGAIVYSSDAYTGRDLEQVWDGSVTVWKNITDWDVDPDIALAESLGVSVEQAIASLKAKGLIEEVES